MVRWVLIGWLVALTGGAGTPVELPAEEVTRLVGQLGAERFTEREAAMAALKEASRSCLATLEAYRLDRDPEVRLRVAELIRHQLTAPDHIPVAAWALTLPGDQEVKAWQAAMTAWRPTATVAVDQGQPTNTSVHGILAQSFVPGAATIAAIGVGVSPRSDQGRWLMVEVRRDDRGMPGDETLCRGWLRMEPRHAITENRLAVIDVPDVAVDPQATYWLVVARAEEGTREGLPASLNITAGELDAYPQGSLMTVVSGEPPQLRTQGDLQFTIFASAPPLPTMTAAPTDNLPVQPVKNPWQLVRQLMQMSGRGGHPMFIGEW
jgi:hypothetical protein